MAKVRVISEYKRGELRYEVGQILDVRPDYALFLMDDAPGCFEMEVERPSLPDAPPVDRMLKTSKRKAR